MQRGGELGQAKKSAKETLGFGSSSAYFLRGSFAKIKSNHEIRRKNQLLVCCF